MASYAMPRRGEIWRVRLDPALGPAVIVTSDTYNEYNWVVIVLPLSSSHTREYDQVLIQPPEGGVTNPSVTLPDQLRAVDRLRLIKRLGRLKPASMKKIDESLKVVLALTD